MRLSLPFWPCEADRILTSSERKQSLIVNPHLAMRLAYAWMPDGERSSVPRFQLEPSLSELPREIIPRLSSDRYDPGRLRPAPRDPPALMRMLVLLSLGLRSQPLIRSAKRTV
jgi:hypothetical protein